MNRLNGLKASCADTAPGIPIIFSQMQRYFMISKMNAKYTGFAEPVITIDKGADLSVSNPISVPNTVYILYTNRNDPAGITYVNHKFYRIDASDLGETLYPVTQGAYDVKVQVESHYAIGTIDAKFMVVDYTNTWSAAMAAFNIAAADAYCVDTFESGTIFAAGNYNPAKFITINYATGGIEMNMALPGVVNLRYVKVIKGTQLTFAAANYGFLFVMNRTP